MGRYHYGLFLYMTFILMACIIQTTAQSNLHHLPKGFVYVTQKIANIEVDLRYCNHHNFMGIPTDGYIEPRLILTDKATIALKKVQAELNGKNLGLKIFDAYRPQTAVDHFKKWARKTGDTIAKDEFYPQIDKRNLFKDGYISSKSGHSRGSTVDLTIIHLSSKKELDMGSCFDFFGEISSHSYNKLSKLQKENRLLLKKTMEKYGFKSYNKEWWHYTLIDEPFPKTYFNFEIR